MELISYLKADQKNIRRMIKNFEQAEGYQAKRQLFEDLTDLLSAHFKAEEPAVYTSSLKKNSQELNDWALKGFEEHNLIDDLIYKIKYSNDEEEWTAQVKVFIQILEMYLSEEESEYFPQLKKLYKSVELDRAAVLYLKIKKSEESHIHQVKKYKIEKEVQLTN